MLFKVTSGLLSTTCALTRIADTLAGEEEVLHDAIPCTAPFPIGGDYVERSFHHTPDIGMADPGRPFVIFLKAGEFTPTPVMRVRVNDRSYGIRAINEWSDKTLQFYEIMLELP